MGGGMMPDMVKLSKMFTRNLSKGSSGDDVLAAKKRLVILGYLRAATKSTFGDETRTAVKAFQRDNGLEVDGIIGPLTWAALFGTAEQTQAPIVTSASDYSGLDRFGAEIKNALVADLETVSDIRREICLDALQFAIDPYNPPEYPLAFYIRGGNLYDKDLSLHVMTAARLKSYFAKSSYAQYFDGGRKEMMMEASENAGFSLPGADCSGQIVGLMRKHAVYDSGFDANANTLYGSHCVETSSPAPGDWAWKSGHIGLYVGGGFAVEYVGGAYGCQLTKIASRRVYSFIDKRLHKMSAWEAFGDPKRY